MMRFLLALLVLQACGASTDSGRNSSLPPRIQRVQALSSSDRKKKEAFEGALHRRARAIVGAMPLEKKLGQIVHIGLYGRQAGPAIEDVFHRYHPGGIILFAANIGSANEVRRLNTDLQALSLKHTGIPLLISVDQEGGRVVRATDGVTDFPGMMTLGQTEDEGLAYAMGFITSRELRSLGMNFVFAPVLDVNNNPANPVINTRSAGSEPELVAGVGRSYVIGAMDARGIPTVKHFAGHGDTDTDSHLALPVVDRTLEQLESVELLPFRRAIEAEVPAVMVGHILFRKIDPIYPSTLSPAIVRGLLRERLKFDGLVITDAMEMKAVADRYPTGEAALLAFRAGVDILLLTAQSDGIRLIEERFQKALKAGEIRSEDIDRAVERQIYLKLKDGLPAGWTGDSLIPSDTDAELIREAGTELDHRSDEIAAKLKEEYGDRPDRVIAEKGVRSLRQAFPGLKEGESNFVFYRSRAVHDEALRLGIPAKNVQPLFSLGQLFIRMDSAAYKGPWVIELQEGDSLIWNRLVARAGTQNRTIVGLLAGSPFFPFRTSQNAFVLSAFSPQGVCGEALVRRSFSPVAAARLRLVQP